MGSSGYCYQLERVSGKTSDDRLRKAVLDTLWNVWSARRGSMLPYDWRGFASDWISLGEDSLLTIEVNDGQITFWFYESVCWSQGLAEHWLKMALSVRRSDFEIVFERLGFRIKPDDWPDLKDQHEQTRHLFFEGDNGIGESTSDGVYWQVKDGNIELPVTPFDELSPAARSEMEHTQKAQRCRCPLCKTLWTWTPNPESAPGFSVNREAVFNCRGLGALDIRKEGVLVAAGRNYDQIWTARSSSLRGPWEGIVSLSDPNRHIDAIIEYNDLLVAHATTNSGARYISTSSDRGRTFSEQALHNKFGKIKRIQLHPIGNSGEVFAAPTNAKVIFRSTDGGQNFDLVKELPQVDGKPIVGIHSLVRHKDRLFGVIEVKKSGRILGVSDDHGATFSPVPLGIPGMPCQIVPWPDALFCLTRGNDAGISLFRSTDGGSTFTTHLIGKGILINGASGPKGLLVAIEPVPSHKYPGGIFMTEDGLSFTLVANLGAAHPPTQVFADPTGEHVGFLFTNQALFSLKKT